MDLTPPAPNIPLLRKAVEWAEAEAAKPYAERQWHQDAYAEVTECGTAYCVAGYVSSLHPQAVVQVTRCSDCSPECDYRSVALLVDGEPASWDRTAVEQLGLTEDEADELFAANNNFADVCRVAERIAARVGERL